MRETHVIVGAGLAGITAAATLRAEGFGGRVVVIGDEDRAPYPRPPLSKQVVSGELPVERLLLRPAAWYASKDIEYRGGVTVTALDTSARTVSFGEGTGSLAYDRLLLATGGRPRRLPGTEDLPGVHTLRTAEDAAAIRDRLGPGRRLLVVGAGFLGAELAANARTLGTDVTVLEAAPLPLTRSLPPLLGRLYARIHRDQGVDLRTGIGVNRLVAAGDGLRAVGTDGRLYPIKGPADTVVVAVGIQPNTELAAAAGIAVDDGIVVDEYCRTSAPAAFAAGDVANHPNPLLGHRVRLEHWQNAQHQGAAAARNMLGNEQPFTEVPWVWSDQYGLNLQIAGLPDPGDDVVLRGDPDSNSFTALLLRDGVLSGAIGMDRGDDIRIARRLIQQRCRPDRDLLGDDERPLDLFLAAEPKPEPATP
ncbi:NAD(P)/FAD-dependent oxidoreductase [Streptomyces sp. bgisy034]|uniref:NAD(P)/FAD-dependent oxidoreductase n=1 Tax=Streptomyces sp. bgisy034 TaxID=3413774 RepID=UPI003EBD590F